MNNLKLANALLEEIREYCEDHDLSEELNKWESTFIESLLAQSYEMTNKQMQMLFRIHEKLVDKGVL